ncbi:hypothetical protein ACFLQ3_00220 [Bacteroidota bacterium]
MEFVYEDNDITEQELEFIKVVPKSFSLSYHEIRHLKFVFKGNPEKLDRKKDSVIENYSNFEIENT